MDTKENFSVEKNHIKCDSPQQITTNCSIHPSIGSSTREQKIRMEMIYSFLSTSLFVIECLLCYAILLVVLIPLFPFIVTFYMLKMAERVIVKATSGELHLPGMDAVHATDEEANRHDIKALLCFENRGNTEERVNAIRRSVLDRMVNATNDTGELLFPRTRCHIRPGWFQYFFQEDQSFEIENHVFKWEGDVPRSKDELTAIISKLSNVSLPEGRSPWYFCCIPTNFGDNDLAVLFKMNHTVADGISLVRFLTQKLTDTTNIPPLTSQSKKFNESPTSRRLLLAKAALITPRYLFQLMLSFADRSILHGPNLSGVKKVAWHEAFELKLIKDIKTATGTTVMMC